MRIFWIFGILYALSLSLFASTSDELISQAHSLKLSENRYWHLLMHAPKDESEIDDQAFFLASEGKTNLEAELDATLRHFVDDTNKSDGSVFCRFPARRAWLEQELGTYFGEGECHEYEALIEKLDPQKVTLVFPSAHINSPASMFGHTFLRIDSSMQSRLMSYAINYAAQTTETNGLMFAYKGLFGGYVGYYSMLPYYEKLKEYRDSESRDVWEYDLNLSPEEVMAMVRHIWELQRINSWYYFFDENCSYHMLWLTEIARPSVHLREHFWYQVMPPETVRVFEEEGLVSERHYRPSKRTKILAYEKKLTAEAIGWVKEIKEGVQSPERILDLKMEHSQKQAILETAAELVEYDYIEGKLAKEAYAARYHAILKVRAALGMGESLEIPQKSNPDQAHRGARVTLGKGWQQNRHPLYLGWRPAFHDLNEVDIGQLGGAQIEFFDTLIGMDEHDVKLEKLTLLSLASITPISHFFRPLSWRMKAGWDRDYGDDQSSFVARVGAGTSIGDEKRYAYVVSEPEIRLGFNTDLGVGIKAGGVFNWNGAHKSTLEAGHVVYLDLKGLSRADISHQWQWDTDHSVYVQAGYQEQEHHDVRIKVGLNLYF